MCWPRRQPGSVTHPQPSCTPSPTIAPSLRRPRQYLRPRSSTAGVDDGKSGKLAVTHKAYTKKLQLDIGEAMSDATGYTSDLRPSSF